MGDFIGEEESKVSDVVLNILLGRLVKYEFLSSNNNNIFSWKNNKNVSRYVCTKTS